MDGTNGDIAVDHYHRYPVPPLNFYIFILIDVRKLLQHLFFCSVHVLQL